MRRSRWMALAAILVVCVGMLGATAMTAGCAVERRRSRRATDVGITRHRDPHRGDRRRRQPDRAEPVQGVGRRGRGRGEVHQQPSGGGARRPQGRGRLLRLEAQPERHHATAEISACQNDVAMVGTSAVFLDAVDEMRNCKDSTGARRPGCPTSRSYDGARPAVLRPVVPDRAAAGGLLHQGRAPADVPGRTSVAGATTSRSSARTCTASTSSGATRSRPVTRRSRAARCSCAPSACKSDERLRPLGRGDAVASTRRSSRQIKTQRLELRAVPRVVPVHGPPAQGGHAPGPHRREGVGLRRRRATTKAFLAAGGAGRRGPVRRHAVPAVPQQGRAEGQPDARQLREVHRRRTRSTASARTRGRRCIAFRDAVNAVVKAGGVNGVTRKTLFEQLNNIHDFNADGMFGDDRPRRAQDLAVPRAHAGEERRRSSGCSPPRPARSTAATKNVVEVKLDLY